MIQADVPVEEETYWFFTFLSGYGFWSLLAIALIVVVLYKKYRK